jgi:hypothetical protein
MLFAVQWGAVLIGLGATLAGIGSLLTGWAALRAARSEKEEHAEINTVDGK